MGAAISAHKPVLPNDMGRTAWTYYQRGGSATNLFGNARGDVRAYGAYGGGITPIATSAFASS